MKKMVSMKSVILLGVLLYLGSLIWYLPASFVWSRIQGQLPAQVTLEGLTGTLWAGQVGRMQVQGVDQGALRWDWQPSGLLRGNISLDLFWQPRNGQVTAQLDVGLGSIRLKNVDGRLDAASMAALNKAPFVLAGHWLLDVPLLELNEFEYIGQAEGQLVWENAAGGLPNALPLGHLTADLNGEDGWLVFHLADRGGPLGLRGDGRWRPGQALALNTQMQARADADAALVGGLTLLGKPNAQGWTSWRINLQ
ncbi:type II secretion system protein N [Halopseudomonas pelagia]|uniref:type II secretion system protein N n=1 Tax=Halopseudomonas pelagia TaxID=553151 RepID=UPI0003A38D8C|nr:type II secretion system protein N [Halopseudomonas pelagia]|tara:strand:- start:315 stop:1070 length:756 start_codon:yes stop_codon:yes gene_type:complete